MVRKKISYKIVFSNYIMRNGKSHLSEKIFTRLLKGIQQKTKKNGLIVLKLSFKNILMPISTIKINKVRKNKTSIPFFLVKEKRVPKIIKSICGFEGDLLNEILKLANNKGSLKSFLKDENQLSFINKNFSHFRWF